MTWRTKRTRLLVELLEDRHLLSTYIVTSTNDSGRNTLRQAILDSNANPVANTIDFSVPTSDPGYDPTSGDWTITVFSPLPEITNQLKIDGSSQPGYSGTPVILINGGNVAGDGMVLGSSPNQSTTSAGSTIRSLTMRGFGGVGIRIETNGNLLANNVIEGSGGNGIEVDASVGNTIGGTIDAASDTIESNGDDGILITGQSKQVVVEGNEISQNGANGIEINDSVMNTIGGTVAGARNVIYGNTSGSGINLIAGANRNQVIGNFIGTDDSGQKGFIGNNIGITIDSSDSNTIGGTASSASNLISGNEVVDVLFLSEASYNVVLGDLIGTDLSGNSALSDSLGVSINSSDYNTIGGTAAGARNLISGTQTGVQIVNFAALNLIEGNLIGTNIIGKSALMNMLGVSIDSAASNTIGGTTSGARNIISGNQNGVQITDFSSLNVVLGNFIGTDITGELSLGNTDVGVLIDLSAANTIGGTASSAQNVISGNNVGIEITDVSGENDVQGNFIGTTVSGSSQLANIENGIWISDDSFSNTIGGAASGDRNIISGNSVGIVIDTDSQTNVVQGNFIGSDVSGESPLGNSTGISILAAHDNTIGGMTPGAGNLISGNTSTGIEIGNSAATGNQVLGNYIGTNKEGTGLVPPAPDPTTGSPVGVLIDDAPANTIGGPTGTGAGNLISGLGVAIVISGSNASRNAILGNQIGTDRTGNALSQSVGIGVYIWGAPQNTVGGTPDASNIIAGYSSYGVYIYGTLATRNIVQGDQIGVLAMIPPHVARTPKRAPRAVPDTQLAGIAIQDASANLIGGSSLAGNTITGNTQAGVYIFGHGGSASGNAIAKNQFTKNLYGILLYNAPNNGGGMLALRKINRFVRNNIADVREFTGDVPSTSNTAGRANATVQKRRHLAVRSSLALASPNRPIHVRIERHDSRETTAPNHPRSATAPGDRPTGRIGS
jgi:parallel beta-helix repeat protein